MAIYTYDPQTNITSEFNNIRELADNYGVDYHNAYSAYRYSRKIRSLNMYVLSDKPTLKQRRHMYAKEVYKGERWKTVEGSNEKYQISNYGRVKIIYKSVERMALPYLRGESKNLHVKIKFLDKYGDTVAGHLVAHHFIRPRKRNERLIRKNGVVTDDYVNNLEYVTLSELGKRSGRLAKSKAVVKICAETMDWIDEYRSAREAGRQNYMSYQAVLDRCHAKTKAIDDKYKFMFLEDYERMTINERKIS